MILDTTDEQNIVQRLKRREQQAMVALYDKYGRLVYSVIFRIVKDRAVAEDLLQETFFRIWNRVQTFDDQKGALEPWVLTVARNRAIDYVRVKSTGRAADMLSLEALEHPKWFEGTSVAPAVRMDNERRVKGALERLNSNQREVIDLTYYEGLTHSEMAERLAKPLGTVKGLVRSALKSLREALQEGT